MSAGSMHPAAHEDLRWVFPAARSARVFSTAEELEAFWAEAPWRVRVSRSGEAVVVERWREHLGVLAMRGVWALERRVPDIVSELAGVARDQGFGSLSSPLVPAEAASAYLRAGMRPFERIVVMRLDRPGRRTADPVPPPPGVVLRSGSGSDLDLLLGLDAVCFDDFWRYDPPTLRRYLRGDRLVVAAEDGRAVGYTLCNVVAGEGVLGRLAVVPEARTRGVGAALVEDAVAYLGRAGAPVVTLSTQEANGASRRLYGRTGFRELPGILQFLMLESGGETR